MKNINFNLIVSFFIVHFSLFILNASDLPYPQGWDELQNDSGWEMVSENGSVKMYRKVISASPLSAFKAVLTTTANPDELIETAWMVDKYPEIFPNAFIEDAGIYWNYSPEKYTAFQIIDIPILAPRLYQFDSYLREHQIHWVKTDTLAEISEVDDIIIPKINFGSWEVIRGGDKNTVIYRVCTDPSGSVPAWIVEQANRRYLPQMMLDLEKYALKR